MTMHFGSTILLQGSSPKDKTWGTYNSISLIQNGVHDTPEAAYERAVRYLTAQRQAWGRHEPETTFRVVVKEDLSKDGQKLAPPVNSAFATFALGAVIGLLDGPLGLFEAGVWVS